MDFNVKSGSPDKQRTACIIVGVFEEGQLSAAAQKLDQVSQGYLSTLLQSGELQGKVGQTRLLHKVPHLLAERVLLVGCGKESEFNERHYKKVLTAAYKTLQETRITEVTSLLHELSVNARSNYWKISLAIAAMTEADYLFEQFKSKKSADSRPLQKFTFLQDGRRDLSSAEKAIKHAQAVALGVKTARDLGNLPPNVCNAAYLASLARQLADAYKPITTTVIGEQQMKELGMNAYLAVGQGSQNESMMSIMEYRGAAGEDSQPIVLVGKGLTFDSGGISIKPADSMDEMKYDMCGAATVYGVMRAVAELQLPLNIIGVLAGCENMPGGRAYRPGDILTTLSGQSVEVLNTDAEGRLVLCDVLTYVKRFQPQLVIDIATLTGACVIALGHHITGLLATDELLAQNLLAAAHSSGDHTWRLPIIEEMQEALDSNFADMANVGGRPGGTITAACFLSRFTQDYPWAHLDIAGTAWVSGKNKGATGRPVPLLMQFLLQQAGLGVEK